MHVDPWGKFVIRFQSWNFFSLVFTVLAIFFSTRKIWLKRELQNLLMRKENSFQWYAQLIKSRLNSDLIKVYKDLQQRKIADANWLFNLLEKKILQKWKPFEDKARTIQMRNTTQIFNYGIIKPLQGWRGQKPASDRFLCFFRLQMKLPTCLVNMLWIN